MLNQIEHYSNNNENNCNENTEVSVEDTKEQKMETNKGTESPRPPNRRPPPVPKPAGGELNEETHTKYRQIRSQTSPIKPTDVIV